MSTPLSHWCTLPCSYGSWYLTMAAAGFHWCGGQPTSLLCLHTQHQTAILALNLSGADITVSGRYMDAAWYVCPHTAVKAEDKEQETYISPESVMTSITFIYSLEHSSYINMEIKTFQISFTHSTRHQNQQSSPAVLDGVVDISVLAGRSPCQPPVINVDVLGWF